MLIEIAVANALDIPRTKEEATRLARNPHATPALLHLYEPAASSTAQAGMVSRRAADLAACKTH